MLWLLQLILILPVIEACCLKILMLEYQVYCEAELLDSVAALAKSVAAETQWAKSVGADTMWAKSVISET